MSIPKLALIALLASSITFESTRISYRLEFATTVFTETEISRASELDSGIDNMQTSRFPSGMDSYMYKTAAASKPGATKLP